MKKRLALLVLLAVLSNCSKKNKQPLESDPQLLYQDGVAKLNDESFKDAIKLVLRLEIKNACIIIKKIILIIAR